MLLEQGDRVEVDGRDESAFQGVYVADPVGNRTVTGLCSPPSSTIKHGPTGPINRAATQVHAGPRFQPVTRGRQVVAVPGPTACSDGCSAWGGVLGPDPAGASLQSTGHPPRHVVSSGQWPDRARCWVFSRPHLNYA